ncbi:MAG: hypothetical protein KKF48_00820 [Nanoarchaeota archaeon]|nr:hypothetical protein [Nanoarchaeota archaeon]MBU1027565.1 hypothetical protein [Nanoarchaeota archaeon]
MCDCNKWWGVFLGLIVIVFTLWIPTTWTKWLVVLAGVIILFHAFKCNTCSTEVPVTKGKKKKK